MPARQKNKHRSRHRTHAIKPANLTHRSLAKKAVVPESAEIVGDNPGAVPAATHGAKPST